MFTPSVVCNRDRKSTRLNSSHDQISYAVFCLKKKKNLGNGTLVPSASVSITHARAPRTHILMGSRAIKLHAEATPADTAVNATLHAYDPRHRCAPARCPDCTEPEPQALAACPRDLSSPNDHPSIAHRFRLFARSVVFHLNHQPGPH